MSLPKKALLSKRTNTNRLEELFVRLTGNQENVA